MSSPSGSLAAIQVPTGATLVGFNNPNPPASECPAIINLQTQLAPLIASMSCQFRMMKLLKPLIEISKALPNPGVQAIQEFTAAAEGLVSCMLMTVPGAILPFVKELLCLEIRSLNCFLSNLEKVLGGLVPARDVLDSYTPVVATLNLAAELFQMAGLTLPQAPVLGNGTDPVSLKADHDAVAAFTVLLQTAADALGGCL
jgi:hypothetical protein